MNSRFNIFLLAVLTIILHACQPDGPAKPSVVGNWGTMETGATSRTYYEFKPEGNVCIVALRDQNRPEACTYKWSQRDDTLIIAGSGAQYKWIIAFENENVMKMNQILEQNKIDSAYYMRRKPLAQQ